MHSCSRTIGCSYLPNSDRFLANLKIFNSTLNNVLFPVINQDQALALSNLHKMCIRFNDQYNLKSRKQRKKGGGKGREREGEEGEGRGRKGRV